MEISELATRIASSIPTETEGHRVIAEKEEIEKAGLDNKKVEEFDKKSKGGNEDGVVSTTELSTYLSAQKQPVEVRLIIDRGSDGEEYIKETFFTVFNDSANISVRLFTSSPKSRAEEQEKWSPKFREYAFALAKNIRTEWTKKGWFDLKPNESFLIQIKENHFGNSKPNCLIMMGIGIPGKGNWNTMSPMGAEAPNVLDEFGPQLEKMIKKTGKKVFGGTAKADGGWDGPLYISIYTK